MNSSTSRLPRRLLGVWAHPDDEAYLSAGLMGRVIDSGGAVTSATLTLGEKGFADDDPRSLEERSALRFGELRAALGAVGVTDVCHLGFNDGELATTSLGLMVDAVGELIDEIKPDVITTFGPDGITGHPDHFMAGLATTIAASSRPEAELLYATHTVDFLATFDQLHNDIGMYMGQPPSGTEASDVFLEASLRGRELQRKRRSLAAHASQTGAVVDFMGEATYRRWVMTETFRRQSLTDFLADVPSRATAR